MFNFALKGKGQWHRPLNCNAQANKKVKQEEIALNSSIQDGIGLYEQRIILHISRISITDSRLQGIRIISENIRFAAIIFHLNEIETIIDSRNLIC